MGDEPPEKARYLREMRRFLARVVNFWSEVMGNAAGN